MNDSFIKCVSSILKYWRNVLITGENEWINQPHSVVHPGLYCRWPWQGPTTAVYLILTPAFDCDISLNIDVTTKCIIDTKMLNKFSRLVNKLQNYSNFIYCGSHHSFTDGIWIEVLCAHVNSWITAYNVKVLCAPVNGRITAYNVEVLCAPLIVE